MPLFNNILTKNMNTLNNLYFIKNNESIFMGTFYNEILSNFIYDTDYVLMIYYINTNNYVNKECIVFKLLSSNVNYSIQNLHAYLNESTNDYNMEYMDYDDSLIIEKDEEDYFYAGVKDVRIEYNIINKKIF